MQKLHSFSPANLGLRFTTSPPAPEIAAGVIKDVKSQVSSLKMIHRWQLVTDKDTCAMWRIIRSGSDSNFDLVTDIIIGA